MKSKKRQIDHIVYSVLDLDSAISDFERKLGVRPIFGGYHKTFGTKNALINLDRGIYLELLAADDSNTKVKKPRWMGIDLLSQNQITRWTLKSEQLETDSAILKAHDLKMGSISGGSRNTAKGSLLKWELILPLPTPEVEIMPFMVDWSQSETHPHDELPDMGCKLVELYGTHPDPDKIGKTLEKMGLKFHIEKAERIVLRAILQCPEGNIEI